MASENNKDSESDSKLNAENSKIKEINEIYKRKVIENRALEKVLKEVKKNT